MDRNHSSLEEADENPREMEARNYLQSHRIHELLNNMTAMLIHARPGIVFTFTYMQ